VGRAKREAEQDVEIQGGEESVSSMALPLLKFNSLLVDFPLFLYTDLSFLLSPLVSSLSLPLPLLMHCPPSVLNGRITRELGFEKTFVPPGPGDECVAVGCAQYGLQVSDMHTVCY
jgi:hypothetical protein